MCLLESDCMGGFVNHDMRETEKGLMKRKWDLGHNRRVCANNGDSASFACIFQRK